MPSSEYFSRQADICLRLSAIASDEELASRLIAMAQGYRAKAAALERMPVAPSQGTIADTQSKAGLAIAQPPIHCKDVGPAS